MIYYSLERIAIRDRVLFGTGWFLNKSQPYSKVRLRFKNAKGEESIIFASPNQKREDVFAAFPDVAHAAKCGFLIYGALTFHLEMNDECYLEASIDGLNWRSELISSTVFSIESNARQNIKSPFFARITSSQARLVNLVNIYFSEGFSQLIRKIKNSRILEFKNPPISPSLLRRRSLQKKYESLVLIVDHNLGGGANVFRNKFIQKLNNENSRILMLTYDLPSLSYVLRLEILGSRSSYSVFTSLDELKVFLENISFSQIVFNNGVSFPEPLSISRLLVRLKEKDKAKLKIFFHDFFLACPSHFLLNSEGEYCGVPSVKLCSECLYKNPYGLSIVETGCEIQKWRQSWVLVLNMADELVAFSKNTVNLMLKAYPNLNFEQFKIIPHEVESIQGGSIGLSRRGGDSLTIGVVGNIGYHKGSAVIKAISEEIKRKKLNVKIRIIGSIDEICDASIVEQTGAYEVKDLPVILRDKKIDIVFFSSIWPETFSYVVAEIMSLGLPIAAFNLGAPAERLKNYSKSILLETGEPEYIINQLQIFTTNLKQ